MRKVRFIAPLMVFVAGLVVTTTLSYGKVEFSKKEKKPCIFCHTKAAPKDGKDLNAVGKFYQKQKSLTDCAPAKP